MALKRSKKQQERDELFFGLDEETVEVLEKVPHMVPAARKAISESPGDDLTVVTRVVEEAEKKASSPAPKGMKKVMVIGNNVWASDGNKYWFKQFFFETPENAEKMVAADLVVEV